jgi:hypothetical protein
MQCQSGGVVRRSARAKSELRRAALLRAKNKKSEQQIPDNKKAPAEAGALE